MEKKSKFFWLYTIILFSVAFVLILFSAFSTTNYKKVARTSIEQLTTENTNLSGQKTELEKTVEGLNEKINQITVENENIKKNNSALIIIAKAQEAFNNNDYYLAQQKLSEINQEGLTDEVTELYNSIKKKVDAKIEE